MESLADGRRGSREDALVRSEDSSSQNAEGSLSMEKGEKRLHVEEGFEEGFEMESVSSAERKAWIDTLLKLLNPNLEVPYWCESRRGDVARVIENHKDLKLPIRSEQEVTNFLRLFFHEHVLEQVTWNFDFVRTSAIGIHYSFRGSLGAYADTLLNDLWSSIMAFGSDHKKENASFEAVQGSGVGGEPGDGFRDLRPISVRVPDFESPKKKGRDKGSRDEFNSTLEKLSEDFQSNSSLKVYRIAKTLYFDPFETSDREVALFHGTKFSDLQSFQARGILPLNKETEFSLARAFYTSNSLRQAYEHVFLSHPGNSWQRNETSFTPNSVMMLVFHVSSFVLHGEQPPSTGESPFKVRWFRAKSVLEKSEWAEFCDDNSTGRVKYNSTGRVKPYIEYDVVLGPICLPYEGGSSMVYVDGVRSEQVAFISERAIKYLESCLVRIFHEDRDKTLKL